MSFLYFFAAMLVGHFLADYPLQGDFLAKGKNPLQPIDGVSWGWCMAAHCAIHAGFVWLITGNIRLGAAEFVFHFKTDLGKCRGEYGFSTDQWLHIGMKAVWAVLAIAMAHA